MPLVLLAGDHERQHWLHLLLAVEDSESDRNGAPQAWCTILFDGDFFVEGVKYARGGRATLALKGKQRLLRV